MSQGSVVPKTAPLLDGEGLGAMEQGICKGGTGKKGGRGSDHMVHEVNK